MNIKHWNVNQYLLQLNMEKRGTILIENVIFIILNLLFLVILILFIAKQSGGAIVLEQSYAKQIALLADSAKPGMSIQLNMEKGYKLAQENNIDFKDVVKVNGNIITVKLSDQKDILILFLIILIWENHIL